MYFMCRLLSHKTTPNMDNMSKLFRLERLKYHEISRVYMTSTERSERGVNAGTPDTTYESNEID